MIFVMPFLIPPPNFLSKAYMDYNSWKRTAASLVFLLSIIDAIFCRRSGRHFRPRIVGGVELSPNEYPFLVTTFQNGVQHCAGTILTLEWIATAAHCIRFSTPAAYTVVAGEHNIARLEGVEQVRIAVEIIRHPLFEFGGIMGANDIALMRVFPRFRRTRFVRRALLPPPKFLPPRTAIAAGWGATFPNGPPALVPSKIELPHIDDQTCSAIRNGNFSKRSVCYGGGQGQGICNGDSGGPLLCESDLVFCGIVSHGSPVACAQADDPGVFTEVTHFLRFIFKYVPKSDLLLAETDEEDEDLDF